MTADEIAEKLDAHKEGTGWRAKCPAHQGDNNSVFSIATGDNGNPIFKCFANCEQWKIIAALVKLGLWPSQPADGQSPSSSANSRAAPKRTHGSALSHDGRCLWSEARTVTVADPAGRYLAGRCCPLPGGHAVRFHPRIYHWQERRRFPAMVALITDIATCRPISLHFTFLKPDGSDKADIDKPRLLMTGHSSRGVVRLCPDDEVTMGIIIGEGIETCLTAMLEFGAVWSCLDAGGIKAFPVLPGIEGITVLIDNDNAGADAFEAVRERYNAAGVEVIGIKIDGASGTDLNDLVRGAA